MESQKPAGTSKKARNQYKVLGILESSRMLKKTFLRILDTTWKIWKSQKVAGTLENLGKHRIPKTIKDFSETKKPAGRFGNYRNQ